MALLVTGAFLIQFFVQGAWGVIPAHLSELSPGNLRGLLPGFSYQCGVLLAGSVNTLEAVLAKHMPFSTAMAATAASVFVLTAVIAGVGRERKGVDLAESSLV